LGDILGESKEFTYKEEFGKGIRRRCTCEPYGREREAGKVRDAGGRSL
jgi:hypothetical protein